ncbi:hypothetical protein [Actinomadura flavalba]|uniref:hypothetical protein n=1 Tax=Actinomadura flavalba TaxID=1120938 RepID=UPI00035F2B29|nr:hypothetical protein [Actinomadura flavalba]
MDFPRWALPAAAVTASAVLLTACGQNAGPQTGTAAGTRQAPADASAEPDPSADPSAPPEPARLETANIARIGRVVTDGQGRTLYRFDNDTARPPASTCEDACATTWPPVWAGEEDPSVNGVRADLVGKVRRPDGRWQVTLGGWPLYRYTKDLNAGDARGHGVGGTWFAAAPTGAKAGVATAAPSTPPPRAAPDDRWKGWTVLTARKDAELGLILTDGKGRVMYRFDDDSARPPRTTCFGACKRAWPPVIFNGWKKLRLKGVDRKAVGYIERRDDGRCQLTINGWPMYYFAKDARPGDTKGQGVQNVWWVSTPEGKKARAAGGGNGGGYGY